MLNARGRSLTDRVTIPVARGLVRLGVTANWLTFVGLLVTATGAGLIVAGQVRAGALVMAAGLLTDAFDGAVAREQGVPSPFGAFYDSVADRVGDAVVLGALAWLVVDRPLLFGVAMVAFAAAQITSYTRAKAESLGYSATVGVLERGERMAIVVAGLLFGLVPLALWILALGGTATVLQRVVAVWSQARGGASAPEPADGPRPRRRRAAEAGAPTMARGAGERSAARRAARAGGRRGPSRPRRRAR